ncbi:MAG: GAF domain-containing protein [Anaerolineae bacterium]|nr:GAF domain-containing protein [Anaerolineae bacterium]
MEKHSKSVLRELATLNTLAEKRSSQLTLVNAVGRLATSILDLDEMMEEVTRAIQTSFNYYNVALFLLDKSRRQVVMRAVAGGFEELVSRTYRQSVDKGIIGWVVRTGQSLLANDVSQEPHYIKGFLGEVLTRSELCVPLKLDDEVIGALDVQSIYPDAFDQADIVAMEALAAQIAAAIRNAQLFKAQQQRTEEVEALAEVGRAISSTLNLEQVLEAIATQATILAHADEGGIFELDKAQGILHITASYNASEDFVRAVNEAGVKVGEGAVGRAAATREPVQVVDTETEAGYRFREIAAIDGIHSVLAVPLLKGEELIGGIVLWRRQPVPFSTQDVALLTSLASQATIAIENARLYTERERRIAELTALNQIGRAISSTLHLDELAELIYREVSQIMDAAAFHIALYNQETNMLDYLLMIDEGVREPRQSRPLGQGLSGLIVTTRKPILIKNLEEEKDKYPRPGFVWGTGKFPSSWLGVPLLVGDKVVGVMSVQSYRPFAYDEDDLELFQTLGSQAAIAVEKARLFEAEQTRRRQAEILGDVSRIVGSTLDLHSVLRLILEQLKRVLTYETASLLLFSAEGPAMIALAGYEDEETVIKEAALRLGDSPIWQEMATTRQPVVIPDVRQDERWIWVSGAEHVRAWIGVPLLVRDEMIGALMMDSTQSGFYTQKDAELAQALANQAAVAIENARLFQAEARRRQEAETLRLAAQALSATLDLRQVFELILAQLRQVVPYDSASVQLLKEDRLEIIGGLGFPNLDELLGLSFPVDGDNPNRQVMATRAPFIVDDASALYEDFRQKPHAQARIRSWLGVPLLFGDRLIGMIALDKREPGFYTADHARLALAFAAQAAIAIENARLHEELQARMREMQTILDHAPLSIALLDTEMRYVLVNKFAEEKEGYRLDEIRGQRGYEVWGRAKPCEECPASLALEDGEVHRWEGEVRPGYIAEETCVPIKDEQGRVQGILNIRQDVTERRRLQAQLLQSGKLSAVGQLISGVAHELNNPLTSIMGYAELVQREASVDGAIKADLRKIYEQAERSAHIVRKLLTFARQYPPMREKTDINRAIEKTIELLAYQLDVDNITIVRDLDPALPHTQADVHQLQQVFLNIINNAHQAMKQAHGRGTLTVRTRLVDEGQTIRITFADDGPGIPPSIITRIFDPFFTTKEIGEGTGLGLAICYGVVSEHGGRIWAKSEAGQGATFFVELPVMKESDQKTKLQAGEKNLLARPAIPSRRILIVEDELTIAGLLARILKLEGHTTDLATDGNQALARLRRADYDAIICDLKMPGLNGQEFYQRLMEMDSPLVQRVIFTTGDVVNPETRAFLEQTDRPCISKPFLQEDVLAVLREVLGEREA